MHTPVARDMWHQLLGADRDALPSQGPEWIECLCADAGYRDASRVYQMPDGRQAILPLVRRTGVPSALAALQSMPKSWGFGGLIAPHGLTDDLASAVLDDLSEPLMCRVRLRPNPLHASIWSRAVADHRWVRAAACQAHVLDLAGGFDAVWRQRFRSGTRTKVRRAERLGVVVRTDTSGELVEVFHALLARSFDRWAEQQHEPRWLARRRGGRRDPVEKFRALADKLGPQCRISVAWYRGHPAAAILVLRNAHVAHYTRGAMDKALAAQSYANYLLHKIAIEEACDSGCHVYQMGESGTSPGLSRFKGHFGAECHQYAEYLIERVPVSRADRLFRAAVKRSIGFRDA
ncbi:GNAT family N-acetyltransferase [Pseudonocardia adelaidensis]|uniref:GNAT family N-acetyltransferase n=1 Tax=Pseudonocardia adelaidensis TaxID=648754 RepID=UPI0031E7826F